MKIHPASCQKLCERKKGFKRLKCWLSWRGSKTCRCKMTGKEKPGGWQKTKKYKGTTYKRVRIPKGHSFPQTHRDYPERQKYIPGGSPPRPPKKNTRQKVWRLEITRRVILLLGGVSGSLSSLLAMWVAHGGEFKKGRGRGGGRRGFGGQDFGNVGLKGCRALSVLFKTVFLIWC